MKRSEIVYVVVSCLALPVLVGITILCFCLAGNPPEAPLPPPFHLVRLIFR